MAHMTIHKKVIEHIRSVAQELGYSIPILMDLQGPKIRVGHMKDGVQTVTAGDYVTLTPTLMSSGPAL